MKLFFVLPVFFCLLVPTRTQASSTDQVISVCESFAAGEIDALKTLETLDLNIDNYSIGINNIAKIFCV